MKRIITILLLLLCITYMLPVSAMIKKDTTYSFVDVEDEKEDKNKKEKKVEVIIIKNNSCNKITSIKSKHKATTTCNLSTLFHAIETPPPDFI